MGLFQMVPAEENRGRSCVPFLALLLPRSPKRMPSVRLGSFSARAHRRRDQAKHVLKRNGLVP